VEPWFVYSGIVHWSILFLAFNTPFIAPSPSYFRINIAQYIVFPRPPCFAIQHTTLVMTINRVGVAAAAPAAHGGRRAGA